METGVEKEVAVSNGFGSDRDGRDGLARKGVGVRCDATFSFNVFAHKVSDSRVAVQSPPA
jgi:hypothetical protein